MRDLYDVIVAPVVTEKATAEQAASNVYTFIVHRQANKHQIAKAVEAVWDVEVEAVWTARYQGESPPGHARKDVGTGSRGAEARLQEGESSPDRGRQHRVLRGRVRKRGRRRCR